MLAGVRAGGVGDFALGAARLIGTTKSWCELEESWRNLESGGQTAALPQLLLCGTGRGATLHFCGHCYRAGSVLAYGSDGEEVIVGGYAAKNRFSRRRREVIDLPACFCC